MGILPPYAVKFRAETSENVTCSQQWLRFRGVVYQTRTLKLLQWEIRKPKEVSESKV